MRFAKRKEDILTHWIGEWNVYNEVMFVIMNASIVKSQERSE